MIFLFSSLPFLTTRNAIPSFSIPFWLQGMVFLLSAYLFDYKGWYCFFQLTSDYKGWYSFLQLTFMTTRDDILSSSLPFWLQGMIFLIPAYLFDYRGWYSSFQLTLLTTKDDTPFFSLAFSMQWDIFLLWSKFFHCNE